MADEKSFVSIIVTEGYAVITGDGNKVCVKKGESVLIPAAFGDFRLKAERSLLSPESLMERGTS